MGTAAAGRGLNNLGGIMEQPGQTQNAVTNGVTARGAATGANAPVKGSVSGVMGQQAQSIPARAVANGAPPQPGPMAAAQAEKAAANVPVNANSTSVTSQAPNATAAVGPTTGSVSGVTGQQAQSTPAKAVVNGAPPRPSGEAPSALKGGNVQPSRVAEETGQVSKVASKSRFANLSSAQRRIILEQKLEANAMRRLEEKQLATPGAHFVEKHGAQLSLASQYNRAAYGINPTTGAIQNIPPSATKFFSARDQLNVINRAEQIFVNTGNKTKAQQLYKFDRVIGEGYNSSLVYGTQTSAQARLNAQGKVITAFPKYGF